MKEILQVGKVQPNRSVAYAFIKRSADIMCSLMGIILLSPLFLIVSVLIFLEDGGPIIFKQERNGVNGKVFRMYKFRSMVKNASQMRAELDKFNELDGPAFKMKHDPRITKIGAIIRKTSIA